MSLGDSRLSLFVLGLRYDREGAQKTVARP
jgi:hypothetical protein